jgi:ABC-2 type transport system permease protein
MRNVLAISQKELKSYFAGPIAYVAIGLWALLYGYFFATLLYYFRQQSMSMNQMGMTGPQAVNVNQQLIRPILQNVMIMVLFVMPMVTMRTYSEEKRSGTIELLLTSPVSDVQIILGKFFGAMALYAIMLAVTTIDLGILFIFGSPEWKPILTMYFGLFLMGGCFISFGLLISSLTQNQVVAGISTFAVFLLLWIITWIGSFLGGTWDQLTQYLSIVEHLDDFSKGVVDTKHVIYYLSFITFGLFLTAKSVDTERWRG